MTRTLTAIGIIMTILLIGCEPLALKSTIMELSDPPTWNLSQAPLMPGGAGDQFGRSIDVSDNYMIVGAPFTNQSTDGGAAYIYIKSNSGTWQLQTPLISGSATADLNFGVAVAISDDYAVVGSSGASMIEIFKRSGSSWDVEYSSSPGGALNYGEAVDVSGDYVVVGDYGTGIARVFFRDGTWGTQEILNGSAADVFGQTVSIYGDYIVVGAPGFSDTVAAGGAVFVYERSLTDWYQDILLEPQVATPLEFFGWSVAIDNNNIIVGAPGSSIVYFFELVESTWVFHSSRSISGIVAKDYFGGSVSISDRIAVVGAHSDLSSPDSSGDVYVFEKYSDSWLYKSQLTDPNGEIGDYFGYSTGTCGNHIVVGAYKDDNINGSEAGSGYVYTRE